MIDKKQTKSKICKNCVHGGDLFNLGQTPHLHCEREKFTKEQIESGEVTPYDTLKEFNETCEHFTHHQ